VYKFTKWREHGMEICQLSDNNGTTALFVPERGGILAECCLNGVSLFYLDPETLWDKNKNIRGGNPVLFPICGPLEGGKYSLPDGREYEMKQHGLARNMRWEVATTDCREDRAEIVLEMSSDEKTRQSYPFDFRLSFTYIIEDSKLTIKQRYQNTSVNDMPFYAGFHPYFFAPGLKAVSLSIPAKIYRDLKTGAARDDIQSLDFNALLETNLVFIGLEQPEAGFTRQDGYKVTVRFDQAYRYIVLWALQDKDFLCLEPWMGDNYDMNRGLAYKLPSGEELSVMVSYSLERL